MAYKGSIFGAEEAATTLGTNFEGTAAVCEALKSLLAPGSRVFNVCSTAGKLRMLPPALRSRFEQVRQVQAPTHAPCTSAPTPCTSAPTGASTTGAGSYSLTPMFFVPHPNPPLNQARSYGELKALTDEFVEAIRQGRHSEKGWPSSM